MFDFTLLQGIEKEELERYFYLVALRELSLYHVFPDVSKTTLEIQNFLAENTATECPACGRWFSIEVHFCPYHSLPTREVSQDELSAKIKVWEEFRLAYAATLDLKMLPRRIGIKLFYIQEHPENVKIP